MSRLVILVLIGAVLVGTYAEFIDYRLVQQLHGFESRNLEPPICKGTGKVCGNDCKSRWICLYNNGRYNALLTDICPGNQTCNDGYCSDTPLPQCTSAAKFPFVCTSEGVFPDPIDCKSYHYCISHVYNNFTDYPRKCSYYYGYNPRTTYCQNHLFNMKCETGYPLPICLTPGQTDALIDNPSMYYVCSLYQNEKNVLYPYIYICPKGFTYYASYHDCIESNQNYTIETYPTRYP